MNVYWTLRPDGVCPDHGEPVVEIDRVEGLPVYGCRACLAEDRTILQPEQWYQRSDS